MKTFSMKNVPKWPTVYDEDMNWQNSIFFSFLQCFSHNPSRTEALMKHGMYYFANSNWSAAVQDFTAVIKQDFTNVEAR